MILIKKKLFSCKVILIILKKKYETRIDDEIKGCTG